MLKLTVLGLPQLRNDGTSLAVRPRRLMFLSYLALEGEVDRGTLAACFWEGLDPAVARSRLRLELHRVQQSQLGTTLSVTGESVQLNVECDAMQAKEAYAAKAWKRFTEMYHGEFLTNLAADTPMLQAWLESWRVTFATQMDEALRQLVAVADRTGTIEEALQHQYRLLELNPYSEETRDAVVLRLTQLGRLEEAKRCEDRYRGRALADLDLSPSQLNASPLICAPLFNEPAQSSPSKTGEPPLVGRDDLCAQLDAWARSLSPVLLLTGEGGVGKSRLVSDWCIQQGASALFVYGVELGQGVPYYSLGETLRQVDSSAFRFLKPVWRAELATIWPDLFSETATGQASSPIRLLEALTEAIRVAMSGNLLVLEDLHWFDAASIQVLGHALKRWRGQADAPRVLATARPGELSQHAGALTWLTELERDGRACRITVPPLSEVAVLSLIRQLSRSPQTVGLARRLYALSGGNAYALLAFLQGLEDQGVLKRPENGPWMLTVNFQTLEAYLTSNLGDILCLAIERHGAAPLRWLETASLLTPPFDFDTVWDGSGLEEDEALSVLDLALSHRWVAAMEPTGYRLGHDLLRCALRAQLRPERALRIHRRLARRLSICGGHVAELARHLEGAGEWQSAYPHWREAARQAARHWAHHEALAFLERARACTVDPLLQLEVQLQRCVHHKALNNLDEWSQELDSVETLLLTQTVHPEYELRAAEAWLKYTRQRAHLLLRIGRVDEAIALSDSWTTGELSDEMLALLHDRGAMLHTLGYPEQAAQLLQSLLERLRPEQQKAKANLHNALALALADTGLVTESFEHARLAIELFGELHTADEPHMKEGLACAYGNQASLYELQGNTAAQFESLEAAVQHAAEAANVYIQRECLQAICETLEKIGDWSTGMVYATRGLELCEETFDTTGTDLFNGWVGRFKAQRSAQGGCNRVILSPPPNNL
jgi:DNA-binding SARP family transcriptional activator